MNLRQGLRIALYGGMVALAAAACVSSSPNRYGTACNSGGRDCTPVVCNSQDDCQRLGSSNGYAYRDPDGRYRANEARYDSTDRRQARRQVCDRDGRNCYWVSPDRDGRYEDRNGIYLQSGN